MALAYLLSPTFEIVNTAGKPATGGYIEVYVSGTRNKYYCASDWNGTLHPFQIPLDSLGSNIVLAADGGAYDVFVYNRYGGLIMSRTNVKPGAGGGMGGGVITSSDGSITVTPTAEGVDLKVNGMEPSVLRAGAGSLTADGQYTFYELVRDGEEITVDNNGKIRLEDGWYHFDATVRVAWEGASLVNSTTPVQLYTTLSSDVLEFDLSYEHSETVQLGGEVKITTGGTQFILGITGLEQGMVAELVDFGIHTITGHGDAAGYEAGDGIVIEDHEISIDPNYVQETLSAGTGIVLEDNEISVDTDVIQEKLTAGNNVQINGTTISATDTTYTAGDGLSLSGTEFSASVDGSTITTNSSGQLQSTPEVFVAIVGVTTYQAVMEAYLARKFIYGWTQNPAVAGARRIEFVEHYTYDSAFVFHRLLADTVGDGNCTVFEYRLKPNNTWEARQKPVQKPADWNAGAGTPTSIANKPDLSIYVTDTELSTILQGYQEALTAGSNIQISNGTISATDTTYTAGNGLDLTGTEFSVDTNTVALKSDLPIQQQLVPGYSLPADAGKVLTAGSTTYWSSLSDYVTDTELGTILEGYQTALTAGSNIQISNGTISATDTTYTAGTALELTGTEFSVKVDGSTVTVNSSGELQAAPAITVDQTYDPTSTNPQSGTAVAEAVAGVDTGLFEATYGTTTLSDIQSAISAHKIVYCRAAGRMAFLAYISSNLVEFQYYRSNAGGTGDSVFVYTVNSNGWTTTERPAYVQSSWSTSDSSAASFIKNKPDLSVYATTASLGAVAFSNDYDDLDNKPSIPELPTTKDLVAGNNITLTEGNDSVTVACNITIGTVTL